MAVRADPCVAVLLTKRWWEPMHRHHAAPSHEAGEGGTTGAEQCVAHPGVHSIGTNQHVTVHLLAAFQEQRHAIGPLLEVDNLGTDMNCSRRTVDEGLNQHLMEIAAMHQPVR